MTKSNFPRVQTRFSRLDQSQSCAGSDFDPQSVFSCFGTVCSGISKKKLSACTWDYAWSMIPKQFFFFHAHSGLQSDEKQKTVKSCKIRSKVTVCGHKKISFPARNVRTGRAFEITNKMTISQIHQLTNFDSTNSPGS